MAIAGKSSRLFPILGVMAALLSSKAHCATEADTPIAISYNLAIVSDYRYRGISLSNRDPALQGGIDLTSRSGFFVGAWASSIANYGGARAEIDLYGGYGGSFADISYSLGAFGYVYPGGHGVDYVEFQGSLGKTIGPVTTKLQIAYVPDQANAVDNFYTSVGADLAIVNTPLTLSASIGRENGGYDEKWDWLAGVKYTLDALEFSASYTDSNYKGPLEAGHNGGAGVVLSAKVIF